MVYFNPVNFLLLLFASLAISAGWGFATALEPSHPHASSPVAQKVNTYELGKEKYLANCSTCHLPIPAEVLPTETWRKILQKPQQHYGQSLPSIEGLSQKLIWSYLSTFSRPLLPNEAMPFLVEDARFFKALHPAVSLPKPTTAQTCLVCHPKAAQLDYQTLNNES
jgi:hypothetical protein